MTRQAFVQVLAATTLAMLVPETVRAEPPECATLEASGCDELLESLRAALVLEIGEHSSVDPECEGERVRVTVRTSCDGASAIEVERGSRGALARRLGPVAPPTLGPRAAALVAAELVRGVSRPVPALASEPALDAPAPEVVDAPDEAPPSVDQPTPTRVEVGLGVAGRSVFDGGALQAGAALTLALAPEGMAWLRVRADLIVLAGGGSAGALGDYGLVYGGLSLGAFAHLRDGAFGFELGPRAEGGVLGAFGVSSDPNVATGADQAMIVLLSAEAAVRFEVASGWDLRVGVAAGAALTGAEVVADGHVVDFLRDGFVELSAAAVGTL